MRAMDIEGSFQDYCPETLLTWLSGHTTATLLLYGESGAGKSTLAETLGQRLWQQGQSSYCLSGDPGSPAFGPPGVVSLGLRQSQGWRLQAFEPLCSLDAVRYRLPLLSAITRLLRHHRRHAIPLIIDAPGVVAGAAGEELLGALLDCATVDRVCYLSAKPEARILATLKANAHNVIVDSMTSAVTAVRVNKPERARCRSLSWQNYMEGAQEQQLVLPNPTLLGMAAGLPDDDWSGRQCALYAGKTLLSMGTVHRRRQERWTVMVKHSENLEQVDAILVRDAVVSPQGKLHTRHVDNRVLPLTRPRIHSVARAYNPANPRAGEPLCAHLSTVTATMVNGVFGDPLLHLQLHNRKRHLLFDLGETGRLPTRVIHQTTDICISHAHADHIGGFLWLLRSRIGYYPCCRIFGPRGIARKILGLVNAFLWDRVEDRGPQFEINEFHGDHLQRCLVRAGVETMEALPEKPVKGQIILRQRDFVIKAVQLDHGVAVGATEPTPVLAYAVEMAPRFHICKDKLARYHEAPGPWLQALKAGLEQGDKEALISLPGGRPETVETLSKNLLVAGPGEKIVYATDLADHGGNRAALIDLARSADLLFCEAPYRLKDIELAKANGHLSTVACAQIAREAQVKQLMPFHFSKRYENRPESVYREIESPPINRIAE
ncbi:adenylyl-sulfate kinase [Pseudomaricurvus alkylphenolicus]|uniref:Clp1/GlmU family protein n=1 Tax=Pseudomaricurvus alkylphenolicus TaxID=1306991 RepID=UPI00141F6BEA|nr:Clp1/GlmU family protein [Pseudomaricurvus alkylphenolicus]NIB42576.1 adenylyl-sulfate kinase [Pseudomaricurvus alkylphenolicus]